MQQYEIVPEMCYALLSFCRGPTLAPELDRRKTKKKSKKRSNMVEALCKNVYESGTQGKCVSGIENLY